jgi:hypothetical protein
MRAYIDCYGIIALPLAALIASLLESRYLYIRSFIVLLISVFTYYNFFELTQYQNGAIHYVSMTKEAYWETFLHKHPTERFWHLLVFPDYKSAEKGIYPDPVPEPLYCGKLTRVQGIAELEKQLLSSAQSHEVMMNKSINSGVPLDSIALHEATSLYEAKVAGGVIVPLDK